MFPIALRDNVIVKPDPVETTTSSGLIIATEKSKERPTTGTVYSVGEECWLMKDPHKSLQPGDQVLFIKNSGWGMTHEGEEYLILESKHLLAAF